MEKAGERRGEDVREQRGRLPRGAAVWFPLFEAVSAGRKGFPVPPASRPAPLPCFLPLDMMLSVCLVLPLILFFKG